MRRRFKIFVSFELGFVPGGIASHILSFNMVTCSHTLHISIRRIFQNTDVLLQRSNEKKRNEKYLVPYFVFIG